MKNSDQQEPLLSLPVEWRKDVIAFWRSNSHLLRDHQAICEKLRAWIGSGLTLEQGRKAFAELSNPERAKNHTHVGELLADLAYVVAEIMRPKLRKAGERDDS